MAHSLQGQQLRKASASVAGTNYSLYIIVITLTMYLVALQVATALPEYTHSHQRHHHHQQHGVAAANSTAAGNSDGSGNNTSTTSTATTATNVSLGIHHTNWRRSEMMDANGLYWLEWWLKGTTSKEIHFRATVNTRGFIGLGFARKNPRMANADLVLLWVDDRTGKANALVSY